ncbi:MAG: rhomboid family intramembrane serine protease [Chitinophagaceae bacterium]|nr:rhomboid family intramembrane serine protease [Chitinophagaceae bacterium]
MFTVAQRTIELDGLTPGEFLALAAISMTDLSWDHSWKDTHAIYARPHVRLFAWGERLSVRVQDGTALITCRQPKWKFLKPRQHEKNIDDLLEYMQHNRQIYSPQMLDNEQHLLLPDTHLTATERIVMAPDLPPATLLLIFLNIVYFIIFSVSTSSFWDADIMDIFDWGGNIRLHTLGGQGWRVITSCFLHFGILHLVTNMIALFLIGRLLEPVLGKAVFLISYICAGSMGSLLSVLIAGTRLSAGASGAIFGLYGVFLALLTTHLLSGEIKRLLFQGVFLFTAYALMDGMGEQVDNAAHVGGLVSGMLFGYIIFVGYYMRKNRYLAAGGISAITMAVIFSSLIYFHNDTIVYERMLQRLERLEHNALVPFTDIKTKTPDRQLSGLLNESRPAWNQFVRIIDSAQGFRFGNNKIYPMQKGILLRYGRLRISETEIWIRSLQTHDPMLAERDSIRTLVYEKFDSLQTLQRD